MNWMQAWSQDGATCHQLFPGGGGMSQLMNRFLFHNLFSKYFFKNFSGMSQGFSVTFHLFPSVSAQCVLYKVYFSAQPNKLRPILKLRKYFPVEHIFVPACSSVRKIHFFKF